MRDFYDTMTDIKSPPFADNPSRLFVEVTTKCNLSCGMCVRQSSGNIREGSMTSATFDALATAFPHLGALILNGIGESLLHPQLETFIMRARADMPGGAWIGFQTNGMLLSASRAASLVDAGLDRICLSLDSASCEGFRSLRTGGEISGVESALSALDKARERRKDFRIGIEFVLMRDNIRELPAAVRWAGRRGASFALVTQLLPYDKSMSAGAAYDTNTAGAIAVFQYWKERARREGVDILRYLDVFMKFSKTPEEARILSFVEEMKKEAASRGIALNLERLLSRDEGWFREVDEVFEEARRTAQEEGVELSLPEAAPRNSRQCEFVEGGSAFVSWEGEVHPCYFLWHGYRCYVGGLEKDVKPWTFGNLQDADISGIWNAPRYRSFRESVVRYQFPFCFDCSFALCDYVQGRDFEQDCHIQSVPCGACLWCTGLFRCLQ